MSEMTPSLWEGLQVYNRTVLTVMRNALTMQLNYAPDDGTEIDFGVVRDRQLARKSISE